MFAQNENSEISPTIDKKELILKAAMKVFSEKGYHEASMDDVANLAGVGKGTVYRNFPSKQDLFLALIEWGFNSLISGIVEKTKNIEDFLKKIEIAIETYLAFFGHKRNFYRVLIQERSIFREKIERQFKKKYLAHLYLLEDFFKRGMKAGVFKKLDSQSASIALVGLINSLIYKWLISEKKYSLKKEKKVIMATFFNGIIK